MSPVVIDASAVVDVLLNNERGQAVSDGLARQDWAVWSVGHVDAEVLSALGRLHRAGDLSEIQVVQRLDLLSEMDIDRLPITGTLLRDAWAMKDSIAVRDALYVAAAGQLDGKVLTTDVRLRRAAPDHTIDLS